MMRSKRQESPRRSCVLSEDSAEQIGNWTRAVPRCVLILDEKVLDSVSFELAQTGSICVQIGA